MTAKLTIVLTGASGGIGEAIANTLAADGHRLVLVGRNEEKLQDILSQLPADTGHRVLKADLLNPQQRKELVNSCRELDGGIDVLINNAGVSHFALLQGSSDEDVTAMINTNLMAPILLIRDLLPLLKQSACASILNIGSTFGTIGYPGFSVYGASKFGLRGFTEALRRELSDQAIAVHYLAPRAVETDMNTAAVVALNRALGNAMDPPQHVADACRELLGKRQGGNRYLGWPERFFVKLNALLPTLVDGALRKQLSTIQKYCRHAF